MQDLEALKNLDQLLVEHTGSVSHVPHAYAQSRERLRESVHLSVSGAVLRAPSRGLCEFCLVRDRKGFGLQPAPIHRRVAGGCA